MGRGHVLGRHVLDLLLHLLGDVLGHLALQHIQQLLEFLLGLRVHEIVVHQLPQLAADSLGKVVQLLQVAIGPLVQQVEQGLLLSSLLFGGLFHLLPGVFEPVLNAPTLGVDNVIKAFLQVVEHRVHVVLLHLLATAVLELLHQLAQAGHLLAVSVLHPLPKQIPQRLHDVALVDDVLRQEVHQLLGVDIEYVLGTVPHRVPVSAK